MRYNYYKFTEELNDKIDHGKCTFNRELYVIQQFRETGIINYKFKPIDKNLKINIERTNKKKDSVNKYFSKKCSVGDRAILLVNTKEYNKARFYKGHMFIIESIDGLINNI